MREAIKEPNMTFWQFLDAHASGVGFLAFIFIIAIPVIIEAIRGK